MKSYLILGLLVAALFGGAYWHLNGLKTQISDAHATISTLNSNINVLTEANKQLDLANKQLTQDFQAAESARAELEKKKAEIQIVEEVRIVTIEKLVKEDPVINTRQLSPVLAETIESVQAARRKK